MVSLGNISVDQRNGVLIFNFINVSLILIIMFILKVHVYNNVHNSLFNENSCLMDLFYLPIKLIISSKIRVKRGNSYQKNEEVLKKCKWNFNSYVLTLTRSLSI